MPKYERFIQTSAIHTSAAEGRRGKSFSGSRSANKYVRLYAPCFFVNTEIVTFLVFKPWTFRKDAFYLFILILFNLVDVSCMIVLF